MKLIELSVYLFTVTTYKFEMTATILITNILQICRVQFMEISCQRGTQVEKGWEPLCCGIAPHPPADVYLQSSIQKKKKSRVTNPPPPYYGETKQTCRNVCIRSFIWGVQRVASEPPRAPGCYNTEYSVPGKRHSSYHKITTNDSTSYGLGNR